MLQLPCRYNWTLLSKCVPISDREISNLVPPFGLIPCGMQQLHSMITPVHI